jgi:hypothetical protein
MDRLKEAVIVDFVRTPFGRASKKNPGFFADVRSDDLGIIAAQALMKRTGVDPALIDDIIIGTPTQIGEQANVEPAAPVWQVPNLLQWPFNQARQTLLSPAGWRVYPILAIP